MQWEIEPFVMVVRNAAAKRRAQAAFMDAGGRLGFQWRFEELTEGGGIFGAPVPICYSMDVDLIVHQWMLERSPVMRKNELWLMRDYGKPLDAPLNELMASWHGRRRRSKRTIRGDGFTVADT
jgi:hypothetical protein